METQLKTIGVLLILLAWLHAFFPKYFDWKSDLVALKLINKQMMQVHTFFIALTVFLIGVLCVSSAYELLTTVLGKRILLGLGGFWLVRFLFQFCVYSPKLWKGKVFETTVHVVLSIFWGYLSGVFLYGYFC